MPDQVNSQIVDSILITNERVLGDAVAQSQAVTDESYAYSLSLLMINAVTTQNAAAQIANAAVVTTCTEILSAVAGIKPS
jgi:Killing trait.